MDSYVRRLGWDTGDNKTSKHLKISVNRFLISSKPLLSGWIRMAKLQCSNDVLSVINRFMGLYFPVHCTGDSRF